MKKIILVLFALVVSVMLLTNSAEAYLISGTTPFSVSGQWSGHVNWSVFEPFDSTNPGAWSISDYSYFYQIFNDDSSLKSLTEFTIDNPYGVTIDSTDSIDGTGNVAPSFVYGGTDGAVFNFNPPANKISHGESSDILYLTSPYNPGFASAGLQALGFNDYQPVPFPVPEPTSMLLLGIGVLGLFGLKRKVKA